MDRNNDNHKKVLIQNYRGTKSTSDLLRSNLLMKAQKIKLNKKISSITIINEGKQVSVDNVASDLQVSNFYLRILTSVQPIHNNNCIPKFNQIEFQQKLLKKIIQHDEVKKSSIVTGEEIKAVHSEESVEDHKLPSAKIIQSEINSPRDVSFDGNKFAEEEDDFLGFNGSFFYSDGNYQLLERLTGAYRVPSMLSLYLLYLFLIASKVAEMLKRGLCQTSLLQKKTEEARINAEEASALVAAAVNHSMGSYQKQVESWDCLNLVLGFWRFARRHFELELLLFAAGVRGYRVWLDGIAYIASPIRHKIRTVLPVAINSSTSAKRSSSALI
ncbi:hypothetical protein KIW84_075440 [Lathyrus oleraceus]|uniref:Uncharacterized protein n=1 Tax=Pisum sativum TaxID=3888 RepID=A0A9D4ZY39_PEA|nr:hypothetical protein KIW84_075440 [Pisum sativum]